jgi:hypothetical protein
MGEDDVAVAIVPADVAPVERAAADENREQCRDAAAKKTIASGAKPHPFGL